MPHAKTRDGVFQRKDRSGWFVSYVDSLGVRKKQKVQAQTRTQALDALAAFKVKEQRDFLLGVKEQSDISTSDLFERYKRHQKARLRQSSYGRTETILETLRAALPVRAKTITKLTVAQFINHRSEKISAASLSKEITTLKHVLRLAVEWGLLNSNPADRTPLPRVSQGKTRFLSPGELRSALNEAIEWMRAPMALAAFTGMRRGELLGMKWADVDLEHRRLYLRETKNGDLRVIVLNKLAMQVLLSLPQNDALVFPEVDPQRLSVETIRLFKRLGIHDASFHSLRHTAASWLVMSGVDLYTTGQILGHRTPRMTQRYAHLSPQYMAVAASKLDTAFVGVLPAEDLRHSVPAASPTHACPRLAILELLYFVGVPDGI